MIYNNFSKKKLFAGIVFAIVISLLIFFVSKNKNIFQQNAVPIQQQNNSLNQVQDAVQSNNPQQIQTKQTIDPLPNALSRITKKPFGIYITPKTSPVQPEQFKGYHTGADLEINPDELIIDIEVKALCDGNFLMAKVASGYGGVAVQNCVLDGQAVTVVYGHIRFESVTAKVGTVLKSGDLIAYLGNAYSSETDGERKHLHLAIHKGTSINILGYVQSKTELIGWLDPAKYLD